MKMTPRFVSLFVLFAACTPLLAQTEVEKLRARCAEQELQIQQLELRISQLTDSPPPSAGQVTVQKTAQPASSPNASNYYTVKAGDHIPRIARMHSTSSTVLNQLNNFKSDEIIHPGQKIKVPSSASQTAMTDAPSPVTVTERTHKIADGETFYRISLKYGVSVDALIAANPNVNYRALRTGQVINLPGSSSTVTSAAAKTTSSVPSLSRVSSIPVSNNTAAINKPRAVDKPVKITQEITYLEFAKNYLTTTSRLDELNGLDLDPSTVLAEGSELYIPAQP